MVPLLNLWAPILLSAVAVFILSSLVHMVLPHHRNDFAKLPSEDAVMEALRKFNIPPGEYLMPRPDGPQGMKAPEYHEKRKRGPVALLTVMTGEFAMGKRFVQWFLYVLVVSFVAACVAATVLGPGAPHKIVFHTTGVVAFAAYGLALWQGAIWYSRSWMTALKSNIDATFYALATAFIFVWLWPK